VPQHLRMKTIEARRDRRPATFVLPYYAIDVRSEMPRELNSLVAGQTDKVPSLVRLHCTILQ
jgi:hypothetical protein